MFNKNRNMPPIDDIKKSKKLQKTSRAVRIKLPAINQIRSKVNSKNLKFRPNFFDINECNPLKTVKQRSLFSKNNIVIPSFHNMESDQETKTEFKANKLTENFLPKMEVCSPNQFRLTFSDLFPKEKPETDLSQLLKYSVKATANPSDQSANPKVQIVDDLLPELSHMRAIVGNILKKEIKEETQPPTNRYLVSTVSSKLKENFLIRPLTRYSGNNITNSTESRISRLNRLRQLLEQAEVVRTIQQKQTINRMKQYLRSPN